MKHLVILLSLLAAFTATAQQQPADKPIRYNAFSHNDYWREHPLFDALSFRFNCVEADLWLIDGELYVAHDRPEPSPSITFVQMYLNPLAAYISAQGGKVYPDGDRPFYLMVDCKTPGEPLYEVLREQMKPYAHLFCGLKDGVYEEGAVLLFLSGDKPAATVSAEQTRLVFLDGRLEDLGKGIPPTVSPILSDNYGAFFTWRGKGTSAGGDSDEMPAAELQRMRDLIARVHAEGKLFRWWGAPDTEQFKRFFISEGVDLIGADDLKVLDTVLATPVE